MLSYLDGWLLAHGAAHRYPSADCHACTYAAWICSWSISLSPMLWFSLGAWIGFCWIFVIKKVVTWVSACNKCVRRWTDWPSFSLSYLGFRVPATHYWYLERKEKKAKITQKSLLIFYSQKEKNLENTYNYLLCNLILTASQS